MKSRSAFTMNTAAIIILVILALMLVGGDGFRSMISGWFAGDPTKAKTKTDCESRKGVWTESTKKCAKKP